ncbi:hypothetical protein [Oceanomicrobium pacificus]|uniref:Uncharacterized protein n=1 Tax=Oceanomicrobium pacificus TaxID=2692916 RepID=A0A6B0TWL0_9RHOB|nr:hypothetical protein [Oceanomicrobium pacificus]MXU65544.1 hypothetical protein [Oceanomicrobium pacificus]
MNRLPVLLATALTLAPLPAALCAAPLTAPDFEAMVEGHKFDFTLNGMPFGREQYLPGRQVLWQGPGGACQYGRWYPAGDAICFEYDEIPDPFCWTVERSADRVEVTLLPSEAGITVDMVGPTDSQMMSCPLPGLGV